MSRKKRKHSDEDGDRWLGTYGDMVTLLMAFFVMLYAISQVDEAKFAELVSGLDVFGNTSNLNGVLESGPALAEEGGTQNLSDAGDLLNIAADPNAVPPDTTSPEDEAAEQARDERTEKEKEVNDEQVEKVSRQLDAALDRAGLARTVTDVRGDPRGVVISVSSDDVLFALGSIEISPLGRRIIAAISSVLRRYDEDVVVEGHTDDLPIRRRGYSNWNLSTDRAVAVIDRLHRVHDTNQRRLAATGYGEFRPLEPNTSASNRARNRRVDILLRLNGE